MIPTLQTRIPNRLFLLKCSYCGKEMKYKENLNSPSKLSNLEKKKKNCVFCGKTYSVKDSIVKPLI